MKLTIALAVASLLGSDLALAQSTTITTGPNGQLSGSVSVPGAPPMDIQAGQGSVSSRGGATVSSGATATAGARAGNGQAYSYSSGPGRSVTVRSPDGRSSSSVSVTGPNAVVAGAGSPGSRIITNTSRTPRARACPRGASRAYRIRTHCRIVHR